MCIRDRIKVLAEAFRVRIEMKQIGARQEAGRIGGIGPCGRELCCATWMTSFVFVSTSAARFQDISLYPQKLAGADASISKCSCRKATKVGLFQSLNVTGVAIKRSFPSLVKI